MRIKAIRYQNFRNFANQGEVTFDTDGQVTIVYGTNGDGKTTLHQLFQWVLYKRVTFNRTTSDAKLYNLEKGEKLTPECGFYVWGEVEFEHNGDEYIARREYKYYKQKTGTIIRQTDGDSFTVTKKDSNNDWKEVDCPELLIESVLPSGLSPYFFFDGETMIADLKIRGTDSAKTLRKALYSIFDLEAYEKAIEDVGSISKSQSVIGILEGKRLKVASDTISDENMRKYYREIKILKNKMEKIEGENATLKEREEEIRSRLSEISEEIGSNKSKKQLEEARKRLVDSKRSEESSIVREQKRFGQEIEENYAFLLIAQVVKTAESRLYMQVQNEEQNIIPGLTKELLVSLLKHNDSGECICGRCLGVEQIKKLEDWKSFFPPASYKSTYDKYVANANRYSGKYDENALFQYLSNILKHKNNIKEIENTIAELDSEIKSSGSMDDLISERTELEAELKGITRKLADNSSDYGEAKHQKIIRERKVAGVESKSDEITAYQRKIEFMERVAAYLRLDISNRIKDYSSTLQQSIQDLIDAMLTSRREVVLNEDFQLQVKDSYGDESKSEGQFAVVSFAYIGGILKVLKSHDKLKNKVYPLVLDGPFSKLDPEQKSNVIHVIPEYAPQVIIFSKDPLNEYIDNDKIGKVWTIVSNEEKNNAEIKEGYLWK